MFTNIGRRTLCMATALALTSVLVSGCGGGQSSVVPQTVTSVVQKQHAKIQVVSSASIPSVMAKVISTKRYYMPRKGVSLSVLNNLRHTMTQAAGEDLVYNGGATQHGANEYDILLNCSDESCWGGLISTFQNEWFGSGMMSIFNQYNASGTYSFAGDLPTSYSNGTNTLSDQDIQNIVHQVVVGSNLPTGYGSQFHVFLPQGTDECDSSTSCYSPDNSSTFQYCAYHSATDFSDIGHVLYSVEPYEGVNGCSAPNPQNGVEPDSQANALSHETSETITDPDPGSGWYNNANGEIGDICGFDKNVVTMGNNNWDIQAEYDNSIHDCSYGNLGQSTPTPAPTATPTSGPTATPTIAPTSTPVSGGGCYAAWDPSIAYNGGAQVSFNGVNYTAAYWTQGQEPDTNSGPAGSGQPWTSDGSCGGGSTGTPAPTPTPTGAPTPTTGPTATPTPSGSTCAAAWQDGGTYSAGQVVSYDDGDGTGTHNYTALVNQTDWAGAGYGPPLASLWQDDGPCH